MGKVGTSYRIAPVDGLRAVAVLGVLWAHTWLFFGNPVWSIGKIGSINIDLNRAISMVGTGVDLFFVISGFCMYLMYARKETKFTWSNYANFLKNRWLRIAPAFYVCAFAYAIGYLFVSKPFPWLDLLSHFSFIHILFSKTGKLSPPFWSLATEWHFYLFLPLFIWAAAQWGFWPVIAIAVLSSIGSRTILYINFSEFVNIWKPQIPVHLVEFVWGICIAWFYTRKIMPPKILRGEKGFIIGFGITYISRLLMVTEVVKATGSFGYLCNIASEPVLALGYALILWNVVLSGSIFQQWLSHPSIQVLDRWSYSLYLWHWWPCGSISQLIVKQFGATPFTQHIGLALSLTVMIPFSYLSYRFLESPYFRKRHSRPATRSE